MRILKKDSSSQAKEVFVDFFGVATQISKGVENQLMQNASPEGKYTFKQNKQSRGWSWFTQTHSIYSFYSHRLRGLLCREAPLLGPFNRCSLFSLLLAIFPNRNPVIRSFGMLTLFDRLWTPCKYQGFSNKTPNFPLCLTFNSLLVFTVNGCP